MKTDCLRKKQINWYECRQAAILINALALHTRSNPAKIAFLLKDYIFDEADLAEMQKEFDLYDSRSFVGEN